MSNLNRNIAILILNWNGYEHTKNCIHSIIENTCNEVDIFVVDNASTDDSISSLKSEFDEKISIISNRENLGFAGGNNVGLNHIIVNNYKYVWLINNDTRITNNTLQPLIDTIEKNSNCAAVTSKIFYDEPDPRLWYAGASFSKISLMSKHIGEGLHDNAKFNHEQIVPFISGCSMFIRCEYLKKIGLLDDKFFAYYEDLDWCIRARKLNYDLIYQPDSILYHKVSATFNSKLLRKNRGKTSPLSLYYISRNKIYILKKHSINRIHFSIAFIIYLKWFFRYFFGLIMLGRYVKLRYISNGFIDGVLHDSEN